MSQPPQMDIDAPQHEVVQPRVPTITATPPGSLPSIREDHPEEHQSPVPALTTSVSANPSEESASECARRPSVWNRAASRNKCVLSPIIWPVPLLNELRDGIKYPLAIKDKQFVEWVSRMLDKRVVRMPGTEESPTPSYAQWVDSLPARSFEDGDPYELTTWRHTLFRDWDNHKSAVEKDGVEDEIRHGIDNLIITAFELRYWGKHLYRAERELFLLSSPWTAKADVVTSMRLPWEWAAFLSRLPNSFVFASEAELSTILTFACEYKVSEAQEASRQLTFDLCSGQHQRRALGFDDGYLFGATLVKHKFTIYVSLWTEDRVYVYPTAVSFNLDNFPTFLRLYIFLCKLSDHIADEVKRMFVKWNDPTDKQKIETKNRNSVNSEYLWRLQESPKRTKDKPSSNKRPRTESGGSRADAGTDDMEDWEPFDDGQVVVNAGDEEPVPPGGEPLIEANIRALNAITASANEILPPAKDIRGWARRSSGSCAGVA